MDACPSPDDWFALGEDPRLDLHLDACAECRGVAAMIGRAGVLGGAPATASGDGVGLVPELVPAGATIGRFVVRGAIGAGAMGVVLEAFDPKLERPVALKIMRRLRDDAGWERARERVLAEAVAMARLSHPNVVAIHDLLEIDGEQLIAMEYVAGPDLEAWLAQEPGRRRRIAAVLDIARGLAAAHDAGVVHRDVKPSNVLVTAEGRARVTDFGLAALGGAAVGAVGTPGYVAPEVLAGGAADARSDQYAFAVTAWRVMFRRWPREGRRRGAVARVLARAMEPDPARRFASMHDVVRALERAGRAPIVVGVAVGLVAAGIATAVVLARSAPPACELDASLDEVWSPARRDAWEAAMRGAAGDKASGLVAGVDRAWQAWQAAGAAACAQPAAGTIACLASQRRRLVGVLEHAPSARDAATVEETLALLRNTDCISAPPPPAVELPPVERAIHDQIVADIDDVTASSWLGQYAAALAKLDALLLRVPPGDAALRGELLYRRADALARTGDTKGSIPVLEEALAIAERAGNPIARVNTMILLLAAYEELGRTDESRALAKVAEAAALAVPRELARDARLANVLAGIAYQAGHYADAEKKYRELVALEEQRFAGKPAPELAGGLHNLGLAVHALGRADEATAIQRRALAMFEATVGADHPDAALPVSELAGLATEAGRLDEAAALYRRAIANWEHALGANHPNLSEPVSSLASVESQLGHRDAALALYRRAATLAAGLGAEHPLVAITKYKLAEELDRRGDRAEAELLVRESVAAWDASGIDMPEAHFARFLLAGYAWDAGRRVQARQLAEKAHAGLAKLAAPYAKPAEEVARWLARHPAP